MIHAIRPILILSLAAAGCTAASLPDTEDSPDTKDVSRIEMEIQAVMDAQEETDGGWKIIHDRSSAAAPSGVE